MTQIIIKQDKILNLLTKDIEKINKIKHLMADKLMIYNVTQ